MTSRRCWRGAEADPLRGGVLVIPQPTWDAVLSEPGAAEHVDDIVDWIASVMPRGGVIADLGCGTGNYTAALARRGVTPLGVDFAAGMLAPATAMADDGDRSTVKAGGGKRRLDVHFQHAVDNVGTQHLEVIKLERDLDTLAQEGPPCSICLVADRT